MSILLLLAAIATPAQIDDATRERLRDALAAYDAKDCPRTLKTLDPLLKPGRAEQLGDEVGPAVLTLGAICTFGGSDAERGYALAERATRLGSDEPFMWIARLERDRTTGNLAAAVATVEALTNGHGAAMNRIETRHFWALHSALVTDKQDALRRRLLKMLAESYAPEQAVGSAEGFQVAYARLLATDGRQAEAFALVRTVTGPGLLRELMVDPALRGALPADFDLRAATERRLAAQLAYNESHPDSLSAILDASTLYRLLGRPVDAIKLLESARARVAAGGFADNAEYRPWWWDSLSRAQEMLGRIDDAASSLRSAIPLGEGGGKNVSHIINLMDLYVQHGRDEQALAIPGEMGGLGSMSPYGEAQLRQARACAHASLGNKAEAAAELAWMRENRLVDPRGYLDVLLCTGDLDAAVAETVAQLGQSEQVADILLRASIYDKPPVEIPLSAADRAFAQVARRPEVQAALARAGGVRTFNVQRGSDG